MRAGVYLRLVTIEAMRALGRNKVRSGLAILGISVAVAAVICVVSIGRAGTDGALAELEKLGDNLVWVEAGARSVNGVRTGTHGMNTLTAKDAQAIRDEIPLIKAVSENADGRIQVIYGPQNWSTQFRGVSPEYREIKRWEIALGEFFDDGHVANAATVIVIGETVRRQVFGDASPLGEQIRLGGFWFEVIGVLGTKGTSMTGQDQDDTVMLPWTTAMRRLVGHDQTWLDDILCSAVRAEDIPAATAQIQNLLRDRHHIQVGADDDFNIRHPEELLQAQVKSKRTLETLLLFLAAIALAIGGIGVMNVMLASVAQRTREIGIRMAVGAQPSDIRLQFLGEAILMTLIGGAVGVLLSEGAEALVSRVLGWPLGTSGDTRALALAASAAVGVFFGLYPAVRASRLDPIEALRVE